MKLAIDAVGNRDGGGAAVLCELLQASAQFDSIDRIILLASPADQRTFDLPRMGKLRVVEISDARSPAGRLRWARWGLDRAIRTLEVDGFLGLNGIGCLHPRAVSVIFIQQALPYSIEALRRYSIPMRIRMAVIRWITGRSALAAKHVLVQTEVMRHVVARSFRLPLERISSFLPTAPTFGMSASKPAKLVRWPESSGGLLYVGNGLPHKNLGMVEAGLRQIPPAQRPTWYATLAPDEAVCQRGSAVSLGTLTPSALAEAYRNATVLVMPSLIETVGLPLLEAMRQGTAVLAADRPYAREVCEDAAVFFNPSSPGDFAAKLMWLLRDAGARERLIAKGRALIERRDQQQPYLAMLQKIADVSLECARRGRLPD